MSQKVFAICLILFICEITSLIALRPSRRTTYVGPFMPRYPPTSSTPGNVASPQIGESLSGSPFGESEIYNYEDDYPKNVSIDRFLQDDQTLMQHTEHLSVQFKNAIAAKLIALADRLQRAARILQERDPTSTSRRHLYRSNTRRNRNKPERYFLNPIFRPFKNNSRTYGYLSNNNEKLNRSTVETTQSTPKFVPSNSANDQDDDKSTSTTPISDQFLTSTTSPISLSPLEALLIQRLRARNKTTNYSEDVSSNDKKSKDLEEIFSSVRRKRDTTSDAHRENLRFVNEKQIYDVTDEVKKGYESVIRLLTNYIDYPPKINRTSTGSRVTRNVERASQMLNNIEEAKKIFTSIEEHVKKRFSNDHLEDYDSKEKIELLEYFDNVIRVEKNRISQALEEYKNQFLIDYPPEDLEKKPEPNTHSIRPANTPEESDKDSEKFGDGLIHTDNSNSPSRGIIEREYQNDDDLNSYVNEHRRELELEFARNHSNDFHHNEVAREEKLRRNARPLKPTIIVRRTYIPPKVKVNSRPTRRHPANTDQVMPAYETSISAKQPESDDDRGYEMIEP